MGLSTLPSNFRAVEAQLSNDLYDATGLSTEVKNNRQTIKHAVTRFRITLDCFCSTDITGKLKKATAYQWVATEALAELPLSMTGRKVAKLIETN